MNSLTAARAQMEVSLGFHMIFAALGIGMPLLMVLAEGLFLRTGREHYRELARKWSKATALLFVVGAVSGTALSFELGLLWPHFMQFAGPIIGSTFALEGYAFFLEAIFIGLYLYGWERLSPRVHWLTGIVVALTGMFSGVLVLAANAWMQVPSGFTHIKDGLPQGIDPWAPFKNVVWLPMALHSTLSCYIAVGFAVAGIYAAALLRGRRDAYATSALNIAMTLGTLCAMAQAVSGDWAAKVVARTQPIKLAAMEAHFETSTQAPLLIGGWPDTHNSQVHYAIKLPGFLSFIAKGDRNAQIQGLNDFAADVRPNVVVCHIAFQMMVGIGVMLILLGATFFIVYWRTRSVQHKGLLRALVWAAPTGFIALEAGWFVTEVGRQPWIIFGVMRTRDAVSLHSNIFLIFIAFSLLYLALAITLIQQLRRLGRSASTLTAHE